MIALFKDRSPSAIIWLFILSIAVHSHFLIAPPSVLTSEDNGLISALLRDYVAGANPVILILVYHALVLSQALRLNYLFNDQRMFNKPTYLTAMAYILLTALFQEWNQISPALISHIMLIWLFGRTVRLYSNPNPKTLLFNIGLIVGCSILLYHPTAFLILVALFALMVVRPFSITELLVLLMGVISPFYILFSYLYLTNRFHRLLTYIPKWHLNLPDLHAPVLFYVSIGFIVLLLVLGIYHMQDQSRRLLIQVRKNWGVLMVMLLVMLPLPLIVKSGSMDSFLLWIVPVSPYVAKGFFAPRKNTFPNLMFWCLVILIILNTWQVLKN